MKDRDSVGLFIPVIWEMSFSGEVNDRNEFGLGELA